METLQTCDTGALLKEATSKLRAAVALLGSPGQPWLVEERTIAVCLEFLEDVVWSFFEADGPVPDQDHITTVIDDELTDAFDALPPTVVLPPNFQTKAAAYLRHRMGEFDFAERKKRASAARLFIDSLYLSDPRESARSRFDRGVASAELRFQRELRQWKDASERAPNKSLWFSEKHWELPERDDNWIVNGLELRVRELMSERLTLLANRLLDERQYGDEALRIFDDESAALCGQVKAHKWSTNLRAFGLGEEHDEQWQRLQDEIVKSVRGEFEALMWPALEERELRGLREGTAIDEPTGGQQENQLRPTEPAERTANTRETTEQPDEHVRRIALLDAHLHNRNISIDTFCGDNRISRATFFYWKNRNWKGRVSDAMRAKIERIIANLPEAHGLAWTNSD